MKIETLALSYDEYMQAIQGGDAEASEASDEGAVNNTQRLPKFYFVNSLNQYIFIRTRDRAKAQAFIDEEYGKGKYRVRVYSEGHSNKNASCKGTETHKFQAKYRNESYGIPRGVR